MSAVPVPARNAFDALPAGDKYRRHLTAWWSAHEQWWAAFPDASLEEVKGLQPKAPHTLKHEHIDTPSAAQVAAYDEAVAAHGQADAVWRPRNDERKKALKMSKRPADAGARAADHRAQHPELQARHREREAKRARVAAPEAEAEEIAAAETWLRQASAGSKPPRKLSKKALAAARANLEAANRERQAQYQLLLKERKREIEAAEREEREAERRKRRANPCYALLRDARLLLPEWRPELGLLNDRMRGLSAPLGGEPGGVRETLQNAIVAATGTDACPSWATQQPAETRSSRLIPGGREDGWWGLLPSESMISWDGSWCGECPPSRDGKRHREFGTQCERLLLLYLRTCARPSAAEVEAARESADGDEEEDEMERAQQEYALQWVRYFGKAALSSPVEKPPPPPVETRLAAGMHPWAPAVLEEWQPPVVDGRWRCDYGVETTLRCEMEPIPLHIAAAAQWAKGKYWGQMYDGPLAKEMAQYYKGEYIPPERLAERDKARDGSRYRPGTTILLPARLFGEFRPLTWESHNPYTLTSFVPLPRPASRVRLHVTPRLMLRGSHCCIGRTWSLHHDGRPGDSYPKCDCDGRSGASGGRHGQPATANAAAERAGEKEQKARAQAVAVEMRRRPPGAHVDQHTVFDDGMRLDEWARQDEEKRKEKRQLIDERAKTLGRLCPGMLKNASRRCSRQMCEYEHTIPPGMHELAAGLCLRCFERVGACSCRCRKCGVPFIGNSIRYSCSCGNRLRFHGPSQSDAGPSHDDLDFEDRECEY